MGIGSYVAVLLGAGLCIAIYRIVSRRRSAAPKVEGGAGGIRSPVPPSKE